MPQVEGLAGGALDIPERYGVLEVWIATHGFRHRLYRDTIENISLNVMLPL